MAPSGHEDQFPPPRLSGRCGFGEGTFAGTRGNGKDAPRADVRRAFPKRPPATLWRPFVSGGYTERSRPQRDSQEAGFSRSRDSAHPALIAYRGLCHGNRIDRAYARAYDSSFRRSPSAPATPLTSQKSAADALASTASTRWVGRTYPSWLNQTAAWKRISRLRWRRQKSGLYMAAL
jgi:hypothetical protein